MLTTFRTQAMKLAGLRKARLVATTIAIGLVLTSCGQSATTSVQSASSESTAASNPLVTQSVTDEEAMRFQEAVYRLPIQPTVSRGSESGISLVTKKGWLSTSIVRVDVGAPVVDHDEAAPCGEGSNDAPKPSDEGCRLFRSTWIASLVVRIVSVHEPEGGLLALQVGDEISLQMVVGDASSESSTGTAKAAADALVATAPIGATLVVVPEQWRDGWSAQDIGIALVRDDGGLAVLAGEAGRVGLGLGEFESIDDLEASANVR